MDAQAREEFFVELETAPKEVTEDNILAVFEDLVEAATQARLWGSHEECPAAEIARRYALARGGL
jgi:hypothetical protein